MACTRARVLRTGVRQIFLAGECACRRVGGEPNEWTYENENTSSASTVGSHTTPVQDASTAWHRDHQHAPPIPAEEE
jgi:hypothetical protein